MEDPSKQRIPVIVIALADQKKHFDPVLQK
jgi:hypothetical protein